MNELKILIEFYFQDNCTYFARIGGSFSIPKLKERNSKYVL